MILDRLRVSAHPTPNLVRAFVIVTIAGVATVGGVVGFLVGEALTVNWPRGEAPDWVQVDR